MTKIAREIAEGIEETLIAGNHSKHTSYVLGVIQKSELEEFVDTKLAPTLALMERLAKAEISLHAICQCDGTCPGARLIIDYEAWKDEQR